MQAKLLVPLLLCGGSVIAAWVPRVADDPMGSAATVFLASLNMADREACTFPFEDAERLHWQPVPFGEAGVRFDTLDDPQKAALRALLASALSDEGLATVDGVMVLEGILVEMETTAGTPSRFHGPGRYFLTVYGDPASANPWGWRIEGHHLSLSFTCVNGAWTVHGPLFFGAQPARVRGGPHAGMRLLGDEDDAIRRLVESLDGPHRSQALVAGSLPGNVLLLPGENQGFAEKQGLAAKDMDGAQRAMLQQTLADWSGRLREDLATAERERMQTGLERTTVLWMGSLEVDAPHYWRIDGPHFVVEYAAPERDPDHVHCVWRDPEHEFGGSLLRDHLREHARQNGQIPD